MLTIETIIEELQKKNISEEKLNEIRKSYALAYEIHKNQVRQSGEPYIIHPLHVAKNLLEMEVYDPDSISAALLHDTIEDAEIEFTKEDIANLINPTVAELVDGVTKMRRINFSTKNDQRLANIRKIMNGLTKDVRIILIKLADRLHNMETLEYKSPEKQRENAIETLELYVPLALSIGAYQVKNKLEDLALPYVDRDEYERIKARKEIILHEREDNLIEMANKIDFSLFEKGISHQRILRSQTICSIYKKIKAGYKIDNIYDLFYWKYLVPEIEDCYQTLYVVHKHNPPINGRFKDYIYNPRTNFYQSLHTTVSNNGNLVKVKIRTHGMDKVAAYGISASWNLENGKTIEETQEIIREKCQFGKKSIEIDESFKDNSEFFEKAKKELLTPHVYPYNQDNGEIIELPKGSTVLDFACQVFPELLDKMTGVIVNGKEVPMNTILKTNDRVQIMTTGKINHEDWDRYAYTPTAQQKIKTLMDKTK